MKARKRSRSPGADSGEKGSSQGAPSTPGSRGPHGTTTTGSGDTNRSTHSPGTNADHDMDGDQAGDGATPGGSPGSARKAPRNEPSVRHVEKHGDQDRKPKATKRPTAKGGSRSKKNRVESGVPIPEQAAAVPTGDAGGSKEDAGKLKDSAEVSPTPARGGQRDPNGEAKVANNVHPSPVENGVHKEANGGDLGGHEDPTSNTKDNGGVSGGSSGSRAEVPRNATPETAPSGILPGDIPPAPRRPADRRGRGGLPGVGVANGGLPGGRDGGGNVLHDAPGHVIDLGGGLFYDTSGRVSRGEFPGAGRVLSPSELIGTGRIAIEPDRSTWRGIDQPHPRMMLNIHPAMNGFVSPQAAADMRALEEMLGRTKRQLQKEFDDLAKKLDTKEGQEKGEAKEGQEKKDKKEDAKNIPTPPPPLRGNKGQLK